MRIVFLCIVSTLFLHPCWSFEPDGATKEELIRLEREWNEAYNRQDLVAVSKILAEEYQFIDADGYLLNKKQYMDTISRVRVKSENIKVLGVRTYGDTAILTSIWKGTYSFDGNDRTETIRYTDIFVRRNNAWQAVSSQGTRVPQ